MPLSPAPLAIPLPSPPFPPRAAPRLVPGFLSPAECRALVARAEAAGFRPASPEYPPSYRNNDRLVLDDPALAAALWQRLRPWVPERERGEDGRAWRACGLNERLRLCRYLPGQRFGIHRDGVHHRGDGRLSRLTFMVYLNGAAEFRGGATRFFAERGAPASSAVAVGPEEGALIVFRHDLWHDGEELSAGVKYVLRSDILHEPEGPAPAPDEPRGYLWNVVEAAPGLLATGSRDPAVRLWSLDAGEPRPCARLDGHAHSATALALRAPGELWSGSRDRTLRIWTLQGLSGGCARVLHGHEGAVLHLAATASGMASGSADGTIRAWTRQGEPAGVLDAGGAWVWALAGLGGTRLASGSEDGVLRLWELDPPRPAGEIGGAPAPVRSLIALPGRGLASGHTDGRVLVWSPPARGASGPWTLALEVDAHRADVRALAALPGGGFASASEDGTVRAWDGRGGGGATIGRHGDFVTGLSLLGDGRLASASYDGTVKVWVP